MTAGTRSTFSFWMPWLGVAFLLLAIGWALLAAFGSSRWSLATQSLHRQLEAARVAPHNSRYDAWQLDGLPASRKSGQPLVQNCPGRGGTSG
jgi:hypothetical protein